MSPLLTFIRSHLSIKIGIPLAVVLFGCIFVWAGFQVAREERFVQNAGVKEADRVLATARLGLDYAMLLNSREDIRAIVANLGRLPEIREIRIINKAGQVMFTSKGEAPGTRLDTSAAPCQVCHQRTPPAVSPSLEHRLYARETVGGEQILRIVGPIANEPGCAELAGCHFHKDSEQILGVLDIAFSLRESQSLIEEFKENTVYLAALVFGAAILTLFLVIFVLIKRPLSRIEGEARTWAKGKKPVSIDEDRLDEIGQLSRAIHQMGSDLIAKNSQIELQKDLYQDLFEGVPCLVTVQDRNMRLLRFNRSFAEKFNASVGEYCFKAYKNLDAPCPSCPVKKTFETGRSHTTEETGCYKDGTRADWIVTTSPVYDSEGNLVAAMEMCLDITSRKDLELALRRSEKKYFDVFNNVPGAVFVIDRDDLSVLDCNRGAVAMYGLPRGELTKRSLHDLFYDERRDAAMAAVIDGQDVEQARHVTGDGRPFFVSMHTSFSEYAGRRVLLVTVADITKRLEAEQQLIQAGKMATLGEMATGVAHEINQPLCVIQTSVDLVRRHLGRGEAPPLPLLTRLTDLIGNQVDRAARIIGHMREFGRISDHEAELVDVGAIARRSVEFFAEQLALRGIETEFALAENLPPVRIDPNRLEQVMINLLVNARDAIEERAKREPACPRRIVIKATANHDAVKVRLSDTGAGFPKELAAKIFEPFFTTKEIGKGTGLGLSISYGIIKDAGGDIVAAKNAEGGATFYIRLPVAREG
ncbi:PAS domain S-box protein [Solidesulfovibrio carbinolicus]|uniref:histidine kinase n=1 Tax=Solidesulfovibrio carbinolicus TaxID=296842 RepID=A0A4P6I3B7_9BACT|nr:PAS domain S-box protein [Solidesulfovibrio carbinolicus]QAZ68369.1 PAS domain-containing sensor histidine kinase [Solidesulfovibrio carbinolicus]